MAQTDAIVNVKVAGLATLSQLQNSLGRVKGRFDQLQTAVAGIGLAAFSRNALVAADSMVDLANATGLTVEQIIDLQFAIQDAGGRIDQVNAGVLRFTNYIDDAAQGSAQARKDFESIGISLEQIRTLSEATLLEKTIDEIAKISDASRRSALMMNFFGKSMREVDAVSFANALDNTIGTNGRYADSVARAAKLNDDLDRALLSLRLQFLELISPLVSLINYMNESTSAANALRIAFEALIAVITIGFAFRVGKMIGSVIGGLGRMYNAVKRSGKAWTDAYDSAKKNLEATIKNRSKLEAEAKKSADEAIGGLKNYEATNSTFMNNLRARAGAIVAAFGAVLYGASAVNRTMTEMEGRGGEFRGKGATGSWGEKTTKRNTNTESIQNQTKAIQQQTAAYALQQQELLKGIQFQTDSLKLNEDDIAVLEARNDVLDTANKQIRDFENQIATLTDEQKDQKPVLEEQIRLIKQRMFADAEAAATATRSYRDQARAQEELLADIQLLNNVMAEQTSLDALQRQAELIGLVGDELAAANMLLEHEVALQARLAEIDAKRRTANAELKGSLLSSELERLQREEDAARASAERKLQIEEDLAEKTKALRNDTAYATKQFLEDLARSVDPAVLTAKRWETVFSGIEGAIDQLVTTGKFNFKDFALSIIADLLKIQMRAIVVQAVLSAIGAIFGSKPTAAVGSSISPIPGARFAAKGANALSGQPFIVGEQGPELFVPKTAGAIVPNDKLGGQVSAPITNNYNTYNINAVDAKSVAQLFAENRKSLLGAVGMAQKEMPYMMGG